MGSIATEQEHYGLLRFANPDLSIPASERGLFSPPANKEVVEAKLPLHDLRTSPSIIQGPAGLDVQGFAYIQHQSALSDETWFSGTNIEDIYLPEVCSLICNITGAKRAIINQCAFRRKHVELQTDPSFYLKRDAPLDQELAKLPTDVPFVYGKEAGGSLEPARITHIDYSSAGLRSTVRECRKDITAMAQNCIDKEARGERPRYAAYSVWRPVKPVKRDPLAVCDWRTLDQSVLQYFDYRCLSNVNKGGEHMNDACVLKVPTEEQKEGMKWYWVPEQKPDEVLILKFADTAVEQDGGIAAGCAHGSPVLVGAEEQDEPRVSIECRVLAFWE